MRPVPASYRLSFLLPDGAVIPGDGRHMPSRDGCVLTIYAAGLVAIAGHSREAVLEHAARFLRVSCKGLAPTTLAMTMRTDAPGWGGIDNWTAIIGADVAFFPSGLSPHIPRAPPAQLVALDGERVE